MHVYGRNHKNHNRQHHRHFDNLHNYTLQHPFIMPPSILVFKASETQTDTLPGNGQSFPMCIESRL